MSIDPATVVNLANGFAGSALGIEMSVRLGHALELPQALWELVPAVVAASNGRDQLSPAAVADATSAGRRLAEVDRVRVRQVADEYLAVLAARFDAVELDLSKALAVGRARRRRTPAAR